MYVGRKRNAVPVPAAVRFIFLLRHSPCQCTVKPNMAEASISHITCLMISCQAKRCLSTMNCWMFVCICKKKKKSKQVEIVPSLI